MTSKARDGNLAFKVAYNDKRWSGICSPEIYERNVEKRKSWCRYQAPRCQKSFNDNNLIRRAPCYDSVALKWLSFSPGWKYGKKEEPNRCRQAKIGKIAMFTSLESGSDPSERFIFAVFRIEDKDILKDGTEYYYGDEKTAIKFSKDQYLNFWDYYQNPNVPSTKLWWSPIFRYPTDAEMRQLLKDIIKSKKFTPRQKQKAKKLLRCVS